jgi:hypothetical protein
VVTGFSVENTVVVECGGVVVSLAWLSFTFTVQFGQGHQAIDEICGQYSIQIAQKCVL